MITEEEVMVNCCRIVIVAVGLLVVIARYASLILTINIHLILIKAIVRVLIAVAAAAAIIIKEVNFIVIIVIIIVIIIEITVTKTANFARVNEETTIATTITIMLLTFFIIALN